MKLRTLSPLALTILMACSADVVQSGRADATEDVASAASAMPSILARAEQPAWTRRTIADLESASASEFQAAQSGWVKLDTAGKTRIRRIDPGDPGQAPLLAARNADGLVIVHGRLAVAMPGFPHVGLPDRVVLADGQVLDVPAAGLPGDYEALLAELDLGDWISARPKAQHNARTLEAVQNWIRVYMALGARAFGATKDVQVDELLSGLLSTLVDADYTVGKWLASDVATLVTDRVGAARGRDDRAAWVRGLAREASHSMDKHIVGSSNVSKEVAAATSHWIASVTAVLWDRPGTVSVSAGELHDAVSEETTALFATYDEQGLGDLAAAASDWLAWVEEQLPFDASPHDGEAGVLWTLEDAYGLRYGVGDLQRVHERFSRANIGEYRVHEVANGAPAPRATASQAEEAVSLMASTCAADADGAVGREAAFFVVTPARPTRIDRWGEEYSTPWSATLATWALNVATNNQYPEGADVAGIVRDAIMHDEFMPRSSLDIPGCEPQPGDLGIESRKTSDPTEYADVYGVVMWDAGSRLLCGPASADSRGCQIDGCRTLDWSNMSPYDQGANPDFNTVGFVRPGGVPAECRVAVDCTDLPRHHTCIEGCTADPASCRKKTCAQNPREWMCMDQMADCEAGDVDACRSLCRESRASEACDLIPRHCDAGSDPACAPMGVGHNPGGGIGGGCFVAGTPITMADGSTRPIEAVRVGEMVMAFDVERGETRVAPVVRTFIHKSVEGTVRMDNGLELTPNHPVFAGGRWVRADQVGPGDALVRLEGGGSVLATVGSIMSVPGTQTVYNLEVARYHDYFAGGVLVHNKVGGDEEDYTNLFY